MAEKEHIEGMIRMLEKLQEAMGGTGAMAAKQAEKAKQYISEVAKRWTEKATGAERQREEARREAKQEANLGKDTANLAVAKKEVKKTLVDLKVKTTDLPDFLPKDVTKIESASVARLVERLAVAPKDLRENPNFILRQLHVTYWSTSWNELTDVAKIEVRNTLNRGLDYVLDLSAKDQQHDVVLLAFGTDKQRFLHNIDPRLDFYRTESNAIGDLDLMLRKQQKDFDTYGYMRPEKEIAYLEKYKDQLLEGINQGKFTQKDVDRHKQKMDERIAELNQEIETRGKAVESRRVVSEEDEEMLDPRVRKAFEARERQMRKFTQAEQGAILGKIRSSELKKIAQDIFDAPERLTEAELDRFFSKLDNANLIEEYRNQLTQSGQLTSEKVLEALDVDMTVVAELKRRLRARGINLNLEAPKRSMWYEPKGEAAIVAINSARLKDRLTGREKSYEKIGEADLLALDKSFFEFLGAADYRPQAPFAEAFNIFKQSDLEAFYGMLEDRLQLLHSENPNLFSQYDIQQIVERYTKMYELKEVYHNLIYMLEGSSADAKDMVAKYLGSFKDEYADFMFKNIKGVQFALSLQESILERIAADYDRRLPPDVMARDAQGESMWTKTYYDLMTDLVNEAPRFEELSDLRGMQEWQKKLAIEMAYGFSIADMQLPMKLTRFVGGRGYTSVWGETLKYDVIRGIFLKFKVPKPGVAILYMMLTGDKEGTKQISNSTKFIDEFEKLYSKPTEDTIAGLRNFLDISSRFGPSSGWGSNHATREWSRELKEHQGFSFDIRDARDKVEGRYKEKLERKYSHLSPARKNEATRKEMRELESTIKEESINEVKKALKRATDVVPLAIIRRWVDDQVFHKIEGVVNSEGLKEARFDLIESVVRQYQGEEEIRRILFGKEDKLVVWTYEYGKGKVDPKAKYPNRIYEAGQFEIKTFKDLWAANPGNRDIVHAEQHLNQEQKVRVEAAWKRLMEKINELEGDLELVQQKALARIQKEIEQGHKATDRLTEDDFKIIRDVGRRERAHSYADQIKTKTWESQKNNEGENIGPSFATRLAERIVNRKERYLISNVDTPWNKYKYVNMGGRGLVRAYLDANAVMAGGKGLGPFLETVGIGHPKWEEALAVLKKEVYGNIAQYWDNTAQEFCWTVLNGALNIFGENKVVTYSGIFGDLWEKWDFISDLLERTGNHRLQASLSKVIIAHDAMSMGPNEKRKVVRMADNMNLLAKNFDPIGWGAGGNYTARAMEEIQHAKVSDVWGEIAAYTPMILPIMIGYGLSQAFEEEKKS